MGGSRIPHLQTASYEILEIQQYFLQSINQYPQQPDLTQVALYKLKKHSVPSTSQSHMALMYISCLKKKTKANQGQPQALTAAPDKAGHVIRHTSAKHNTQLHMLYDTQAQCSTREIEAEVYIK